MFLRKLCNKLPNYTSSHPRSHSHRHHNVTVYTLDVKTFKKTSSEGAYIQRLGFIRTICDFVYTLHIPDRWKEMTEKNRNEWKENSASPSHFVSLQLPYSGTRFPATYCNVRSVELRTLRNHVRYWIQSQLRVSNGKKRLYQVAVLMYLLLPFVGG
jgi:hypothetical protein